MKKLVVDIDNTICIADNRDYENAKPIQSVIDKVKALYNDGWYIILYTSRNMNSYDNNIGLINARTLPIIINWLERHQVAYHEIHVGKPLAREGFYIDDRAIRPKEFIENSMDQLETICNNDMIYD